MSIEYRTISYGRVDGGGIAPDFDEPLAIESYSALLHRLKVSSVQVVTQVPGIGVQLPQPVVLNKDGTLLASAIRTVLTSSGPHFSIANRGIILTLNVSAIDPTGSLVLTLEGQDKTTGTYYTVATFSAVTTVSLNVFVVYPGITEVVGSRFNMVLPSLYRITCTPANAVNITYSLSENVIV